MILSKEEERLVLNHRKERADAVARELKKSSCKHDWAYRGEWRGESGYICYKCDSTKFE